MHCYLFSSPPEPSPEALVDLVRQILGENSSALLGYLPAGNIQRHFVREVKALFRGVARVSAIKPEVHSPGRVRTVLNQANLLLIPGGNTYLMAQRLHQTGLLPGLRQRIVDGLPLVTFSAGTVLCGQDVLTTNDINCCGCTQFAGLGLVPYNFNVHYPAQAGPEQEERDERIGEYSAFHTQPVLALQDGACLHITPGKLEVLSGQVWKFSDGDKEACQGLEWPPNIGM